MERKQLEEGIVVISLDVELGWGYYGQDGGNHVSQDGSRERQIITRLLDLFDRMEAPVTWAVTGHLFLEECDGIHLDVQQPAIGDSDDGWFEGDPGTTLEEAPLWYGPDIVQAIEDADVDHEIGTHTFSHIKCNRPGTSAEVLRSELRKCKEVARTVDCELSSLVFPANQVNHLETVANEGIEVYRGRTPRVEIGSRWVDWRTTRFLYFLFGRTPPLVEPVETVPGLWNLPASQYLAYPHPTSPLHRVANRFPLHSCVRQAKQAIAAAKREKKIFHAWAHPHEFTDWRIRDLEMILEEANRQSVPVRTMHEVVADEPSATD